jgi:hypothetical protein
LDAHIFNESEMARSSECREQYAQKTLDTADIVREAIFAAPTLFRVNGCAVLLVVTV